MATIDDGGPAYLVELRLSADESDALKWAVRVSLKDAIRGRADGDAKAEARVKPLQAILERLQQESTQ